MWGSINVSHCIIIVRIIVNFFLSVVISTLRLGSGRIELCGVKVSYQRRHSVYVHTTYRLNACEYKESCGDVAAVVASAVASFERSAAKVRKAIGSGWQISDFWEEEFALFMWNFGRAKHSAITNFSILQTLYMYITTHAVQLRQAPMQECQFMLRLMWKIYF